jgi:hypothetical protein
MFVKTITVASGLCADEKWRRVHAEMMYSRAPITHTPVTSTEVTWSLQHAKPLSGVRQ